LGVVECKLCSIGIATEAFHFRCGIGFAGDKGVKQFSGLAFELVQVGFSEVDGWVEAISQ
jgi:hypothetical protein